MDAGWGGPAQTGVCTFPRGGGTEWPVLRSLRPHLSAVVCQHCFVTRLVRVVVQLGADRRSVCGRILHTFATEIDWPQPMMWGPRLDLGVFPRDDSRLAAASGRASRQQVTSGGVTVTRAAARDESKGFCPACGASFPHPRGLLSSGATSRWPRSRVPTELATTAGMRGAGRDVLLEKVSVQVQIPLHILSPCSVDRVIDL